MLLQWVELMYVGVYNSAAIIAWNQEFILVFVFVFGDSNFIQNLFFIHLRVALTMSG